MKVLTNEEAEMTVVLEPDNGIEKTYCAWVKVCPPLNCSCCPATNFLTNNEGNRKTHAEAIAWWEKQ